MIPSIWPECNFFSLSGMHVLWIVFAFPGPHITSLLIDRPKMTPCQLMVMWPGLKHIAHIQHYTQQQITCQCRTYHECIYMMERLSVDTPSHDMPSLSIFKPNIVKIYQSCQWHSWLLLKQKLGRPLPLSKAILFQIIKWHLVYETWLFLKGPPLFETCTNLRKWYWKMCWKPRTPRTPRTWNMYKSKKAPPPPGGA